MVDQMVAMVVKVVQYFKSWREFKYFNRFLDINNIIKQKEVTMVAGQNRTGKSGDDLILKVPLGTQVFEEDNKTLIFDFIKIGEEFVAAAGGKGGLGNTRFKSSNK